MFLCLRVINWLLSPLVHREVKGHCQPLTWRQIFRSFHSTGKEKRIIIKTESCWIHKERERDWSCERYVFTRLCCLCHTWIMDELVIINPAFSGTVVWRSRGTAKGRTEHWKQPNRDQTWQLECEEQVHSLSPKEMIHVWDAAWRRVRIKTEPLGESTAICECCLTRTVRHEGLISFESEYNFCHSV